MRQGRSLTPTEVATVRRNVRFDVTVHSAGVLTLIGAAIRLLPHLLKKRPQYFGGFEQRFLNEKPRPTVWWLERAIWILAHATTGDCSRRSFGSWLIPEMLREVLHLDCIAGFTTANLQALGRQNDPVVAAWRQTERVVDDWAGALAQAAQCSKGWVYERRKQILAKYKIDIALPFAFYRDLAFYGPSSVTPPHDRAALNAALARGDAATNLRLRQRAVKDFDRRRIGVGDAPVTSPPLLMSPKVAIDRTIVEHDRPVEGRTVPCVTPRDPNVAAAKVPGSRKPSRGLNLSARAHAALPSQRIDALPSDARTIRLAAPGTARGGAPTHSSPRHHAARR